MKSKFFTRNLLLLGMLFVSITVWGDTTYKLTQVTESALFGESISFSPATYLITCHEGDNNYQVERTEGETLSLDDPLPVGGMEFAGWSSTNDVSSPIWVTNSTVVTANMELYAFFLIAEGKWGYYLVEEDQTDWRGDYLIAYSSTQFADGKKAGTGKDGIGSAASYKNPYEDLVDNVVNVTWGNSYYVTLEAINDEDLSEGYVLKTQDGRYNYYTNNSGDGLSDTDYKPTAAQYPISVTFTSSSDIKLKLGGSALGSVFRYNSSSKWFRFAKNGAQKAIYLYKKSQSPSVYSLGKSKSVTITTAKYATYCSDEGLDFSGTGAKVYKAKVTGSSVKLTEITGGIVPANTGVMVYKDVAATENLSVPVTLTDATVTDNELVGITVETEVPWTADGKYNYILQKQGGDETPKFYKATGKKLVANRAYLSTTYNVASGRGLDIVFEGEEEEGDVTGVASVARPQATNNHCYDLQGRQVMQPTQKGLYIVNGKKYVVK